MKKHKNKTIRKKVRNALLRLGMQAKAKEVADALGESGLSITEELVEQVRFQELKQRGHQGRISQSLNRVGKQQRVQKIPQKRPGRK